MQVTQRPHLHLDWIDPDALEIVERLQRRNFTTYLVGGCVRDLMVNVHPKDYDIATTALPEDVRSLVPRSYIIGKRFRLVLVRRGERQFEVATFRRDPKPHELEGDEPFFGENFFGTPEEDAKRRDFTINSIFYDPIKNELIDYCDGSPDIKARILRMIGDPDARLKEDPIRILRALRLAHKLGFKIEENLKASMKKNADEIKRSVLPRKREEMLKILKLDNVMPVFFEMYDLGILSSVFTSFVPIFEDEDKLSIFEYYITRLSSFCIDAQSPAHLFSCLLFAHYRALVDSEGEAGVNPIIFLERPEIKFFYRDELGMSNVEQRIFAKAMHLQSLLKNSERFKRRGERRMFAVLSDESFPIALNFAKLDYLLSPGEILFWEKAYERAIPRIHEMKHLKEAEKRDRRRRRSIKNIQRPSRRNNPDN